jgi:hypothetical protein
MELSQAHASEKADNPQAASSPSSDVEFAKYLKLTRSGYLSGIIKQRDHNTEFAASLSVTARPTARKPSIPAANLTVCYGSRRRSAVLNKVAEGKSSQRWKIFAKLVGPSFASRAYA